jgi:hypothetical protein
MIGEQRERCISQFGGAGATTPGTTSPSTTLPGSPGAGSSTRPGSAIR